MKSLSLIPIVIVAVLFSFSSCKKEPAKLVIDPCGIDFGTTIHYTSIGDDFFSGSILFPDSSIGYYVKQKLENFDFEVTEFDEFYVEGGNAHDLIGELEVRDPQCVNLMTVIIGYNDILENTPSETFRDKYSTLLNRCIAISGSSSSVSSSRIPDFSTAPGLSFSDDPAAVTGFSQRISEFNMIIEEEASELNVNIADVVLTTVMFNSNLFYEDSAIGGDSIHPGDDLIRAFSDPLATAVFAGL